MREPAIFGNRPVKAFQSAREGYRTAVRAAIEKKKGRERHEPFRPKGLAGSAAGDQRPFLPKKPIDRAEHHMPTDGNYWNNTLSTRQLAYRQGGDELERGATPERGKAH